MDYNEGISERNQLLGTKKVMGKKKTASKWITKSFKMFFRTKKQTN